MGVNQEARAGKAWVVLTDAAAKRRTLTYSELGEAIQVHRRHLNRPLGFIQDQCMEARLPPLTILVLQKGGVHGTGFIAWDIGDLDEGFEKVFAFNWGGLPNPFAYALLGETQEDLASRLLEAPQRSEEVYRKVVERGIAQQIFRSALLEAYDCSCAFCGLAFVDALDAAHVVPWESASPSERMDVRNGLLLCATHHRLFDAGWLWVTEDHRVQHAPEPDEPYNPIEVALLKDLHGRKIRLPANERHRPDPRLLRKRASLMEEPGTADEDPES